MGKTVHAEFAVHSQGITYHGQELPDGLPDEELKHIESTGALNEEGPPATDAVDAAYGTKSGSEENYLGETPPDAPEEEEPVQPPYQTSDEAEEFAAGQPTRGDWATTFSAEGGVRQPTPSPVVNQKGERVPAPKPNLQGGQPETRRRSQEKSPEKSQKAEKQPQKDQ
jgi:hypothetical protein